MKEERTVKFDASFKQRGRGEEETEAREKKLDADGRICHSKEDEHSVVVLAHHFSVSIFFLASRRVVHPLAPPVHAFLIGVPFRTSRSGSERAITML